MGIRHKGGPKSPGVRPPAPIPTLTNPGADHYWSAARATGGGPGDVATSIRDAIGIDHMMPVAGTTGPAPVIGLEGSVPFVTFGLNGGDLASAVSALGKTSLVIMRAPSTNVNGVRLAAASLGRGATGRYRALVTHAAGQGSPDTITTAEPSSALWQVIVYVADPTNGPRLYVNDSPVATGPAYTPPTAGLAISHPVNAGTADVAVTATWPYLFTVAQAAAEIGNIPNGSPAIAL